MTRHEIRRLGGSILKVLSPASLEELLCCGSIAGTRLGPMDDAKLYHKASYNSPED